MRSMHYLPAGCMWDWEGVVMARHPPVVVAMTQPPPGVAMQPLLQWEGAVEMGLPAARQPAQHVSAVSPLSLPLRLSLLSQASAHAPIWMHSDSCLQLLAVKS